MSYVLERGGEYLVVNGVARRDRFVARGFRWVNGPPAPPEPSYRELQEQARAAGIPANQSREALKAALGGAA